MHTKKEISAEFPFESKYLEVKGSKIHYIEEGEGDPILFLHGNPTSSYLWRNIIPHLSGQGRCIALDLIGMGKSDKPDIKYGFKDSYDYLEAFIEKMGLKNITLVLHDWGSALGFNYAYNHPDDIKGIVFMEAMFKTFEFSQFPADIRMAMKMMRSPIFGPFMVKVANIFIKKMIPDMIVRKLTKQEQAMYAEPYPTISSRTPLLAWPKDVPIAGIPKYSFDTVNTYVKWLRETTLPKLCLYVEPGIAIKKEDAEWIKNNFKNTTMVHLGEGLHYIQEDYPHEIGEEISEWYKRIGD
jgi:haloalkane dehalogenase